MTVDEKKSFLGANLPLVVIVFVAIMLAGIIFLSMGLEPDGRGTVTDTDNDELRVLTVQGARLVDIRTSVEYEHGHIPGAEFVELAGLATAADEWDRSRPVVVYGTDGSRSADAVEVLAGMGFEVFHLTEGIIDWEGELSTGADPGEFASGLPVMYEFSADS